MWLPIIICSAVFLGVYDIFKKISVRDNAVLLVLLFSNLSSLILFVPLFLLSCCNPDILQDSIFFIPFTSLHDQLLIFLKSIIVLSSWICVFFAMKYLPISIVSPIRSSAPMWTLIGAVLILQESLSVSQWVGIIIIIVSLYLYAILGRKEGIIFTRNVWVLFVFIGTILGSISALYDKYLISQCGIPKMEVQAYATLYQTILMALVVAVLWMPNKQRLTAFQWRWSIPLIGIFLVIADFFYYYALSCPGALIAVISSIRRSNVIISFLSGAFLFKEKNIKKKGVALIGVLVGIFILLLVH